MLLWLVNVLCMLFAIGLVLVTCINTLHACNIVHFSQVENNCIRDLYYACAADTGLTSYLYSCYIVAHVEAY